MAKASIGEMIGMACGTVVGVLTVVDKTVKSLENLATSAEEASGQYLDEARAKRSEQKFLLDQKLIAMKAAHAKKLESGVIDLPVIEKA